MVIPYDFSLFFFCNQQQGAPKPIPQLTSPSDDDDDVGASPADLAAGTAAYMHYYQQRTYNNMPDEFGYIADAVSIKVFFFFFCI